VSPLARAPTTAALYVEHAPQPTAALVVDEPNSGSERLKDLLRQVAHLPAAGIAARVSAALKDWIRDAEQFDDLTFIVMKVR
jgi:serine phosphatase RsbU (regulator of sigma subunit)